MVMAEIGGPLAHQLHSHRGLVQPSLVMNHHLDLDCHGHEINLSEFRLRKIQCSFPKGVEMVSCKRPRCWKYTTKRLNIHRFPPKIVPFYCLKKIMT